jgi:hypothetical protein
LSFSTYDFPSEFVHVKLHAETVEATERMKRALMARCRAAVVAKRRERKEADSEVWQAVAFYEPRIQGQSHFASGSAHPPPQLITP